MIRKIITEMVEETVRDLQATGRLDVKELPKIALERPKEKQHGDFATNVALVLGKTSNQVPRKLADELVGKLVNRSPFIAKIEVAGPGFINFFVSEEWLYQLLARVYDQRDDYSFLQFAPGMKVQVEFVSANPVGPLHVGHGRWAAVGDTLSNLLSFTGHTVSREFYINDFGSQVHIFGESVNARYLERLGKDAQFPEKGYQGAYIADLAETLVSEKGDEYLALSDEERLSTIEDWASQRMLEETKETLERMGVRFDNWFSERALHESGAVAETIAKLDDKGLVYEESGARWLRTSSFGDDQDRVLIRENGQPTYFAADIAYHLNKLDRDFDRLINVWGADHHGYVPRVGAALEALGHEGVLEVVVGQLVNLYRGGEPVRMSKRTGDIITLRELLDEVGEDAARFFFLMRSTDSALDFDLELAKSESQENPVYYVQYAHARICSIIRFAQEKGVSAPMKSEAVDLHVLHSPSELELLRKLSHFEEIVEKATLNRAPHYLTRYAQDVAAVFHVFYTNCRVVTEDTRLSEARLVLAVAAQAILRKTLELLGVSAPDNM